MLSFHVRNLRSIEDSTRIELRPLTLVVGRNSAGKSTLLRVLPLLRQSVERRTSGPLLWYGELVDFGSFADAVRWGAEKREIVLEFGIHLPKRPRRYAVTSRAGLPARISLTIANGDRSPSVVRIGLVLGDVELEAIIGADGRWTHASVQGVGVDLTQIEPVSAHERTPFVSLNVGGPPSTPGGGRTNDVLQSFFPGGLRGLYLGQLMEWGPTRDDIKQQLRSIAIRHGGDPRPPNDDALVNLQQALLVRDMAGLFAEALQALAEEATAVAYLGPFRDPPKRHYRISELAMDVIDADGANTAMVIRSLSPAARRRLKAWLTEHLGFGVELKDTDAHVQIQVTEGSLPAANLIDVGFGVSQLLPVAIQLWLLMNTEDGPASTFRTFVMEQPELHLHPAHQAQLGALLASAASKASHNNGEEPRRTLLVETHSAELVEAVGRAVYDGSLPPEAAQVILVEKDQTTGDSTVRVATFDERGELQNWPAGFFVP